MKKDRTEYHQKYYKNNTNKCKTNSTNYYAKSEIKYKKWEDNLKQKYKITPNEYFEILKDQNNVCAICENPDKKNKKLSVDHNHETGKVRGLLCTNCNQGLGQFSDTIKLFERAIDYLKKSEE